ncbi:MAG TPA: nuclear transport factor 2 family protein [Pyrinomonadaceae bacterium]|jgi:hypothetical protein
MRENFILLAFLTLLILGSASCGGPSPASNAGNANNANTNVAAIPSPSKKPEAETVNNAPTLGPVVQKYYDALKNKDNASLRDTLTKDFIGRIEKDMKQDKQTDLAAYVANTDYRSGSNLEVRNEKIEGDKAVAEIRGAAYKNWTPFEFAKEDGKWKFTGGSSDIDAVKSQSNSNAAR